MGMTGHGYDRDGSPWGNGSYYPQRSSKPEPPKRIQAGTKVRVTKTYEVASRLGQVGILIEHDLYDVNVPYHIDFGGNDCAWVKNVEIVEDAPSFDDDSTIITSSNDITDFIKDDAEESISNSIAKQPKALL